MIIDKSKKFLDYFKVVDNNNKKLPRELFRNIDFLVLHHIQANSVDHALKQLIDNQVSSHFLIDELGNIFELVDEYDVAYHAGISYWNGVDGLNESSIGIEFINSAPFDKKFNQEQLIAGIALSKYLIAKYKIKQQNVVGHSDIAYSKETGFLDRKQDPSHLFDWEFFAQNKVGLSFEDFKKDFAENVNFQDFDRKFKLGDKNLEIKNVKEVLKNFGYRVLNLNDEFDEEMRSLMTVFKRRFKK